MREEVFDRPPAGMTSIADGDAAPTGASPDAGGAAEVLELARPVRPEAPIEPMPAAEPARGGGLGWLKWVVALLLVVGAGGAAWKYRPRPTLKVAVPDVLVTSEPTGAALKIGDETVGETPWAGSNAWVGEVKWELSAPGYQKKKGTFVGGTPVRLDVKLQKGK